MIKYPDWQFLIVGILKADAEEDYMAVGCSHLISKH